MTRRPQPRGGAPRALVVAACMATTACGGTSPRPTTSGDPVDDVSPDQLFDRGVAFAQRGDYVRAEHYLLAARSRGVPDARVVPLLMEVCVRSNRFAAAIQYAEPYLAQAPREWPLRVLVASLQIALDRPAEARAHLVLAIQHASPPSGEAHYLLGVVHRMEGRDEDARGEFRRALELAPDGPHAEEIRDALRRWAQAEITPPESAPSAPPPADAATSPESPAQGASR